MTVADIHEKDSLYISFRCALSPTSLEYKAFMESLFTDYIASYEFGEKNETPHFHCLFAKKGLRRKAFNEMVKTKFGLNGNKDYSTKNVAPTDEDYQRALQYLCKGDKDSTKIPPTILWASSNYTPEVISKAHYDYHVAHGNYERERQEEIYNNLNVKIPPVKKARTWTEKTQDYIDETYPGKEWDYGCRADVELMLDITLEKMGVVSKKLSPKIVEETALGFLNHVNAIGLRPQFKTYIMGQFFIGSHEFNK